MKSRVAYARPFYMAGAIVASLTLSDAAAQGNTDRDRDSIVGLVHRVVGRMGGTSTTRTYSRAGALLETHAQRPSADRLDVGQRTHKTVYEYDTEGRRTREMIDEGDGLPYPSWAYTYDRSGRVLAEASYNQTREETTNLSDSSLNGTRLSSYEFDAQGNWIARTIRRCLVSGDEAASAEVTERAITYYGSSSE